MKKKCRIEGCIREFNSYDGRIYHEEHGHKEEEKKKPAGYNCGKPAHDHPNHKAAKQCVYRRNVKKDKK